MIMDEIAVQFFAEQEEAKRRHAINNELTLIYHEREAAAQLLEKIHKYGLEDYQPLRRTILLLEQIVFRTRSTLGLAQELNISVLEVNPMLPLRGIVEAHFIRDVLEVVNNAIEEAYADVKKQEK